MVEKYKKSLKKRNYISASSYAIALGVSVYNENYFYVSFAIATLITFIFVMKNLGFENDLLSDLTMCIRNEDLDELQNQLQLGGDPNKIDRLGNTPLTEAIDQGGYFGVNCVALLLAYGADPKKAINGNTALEYAIQEYESLKKRAKDDCVVDSYKLKDIIKILSEKA